MKTITKFKLVLLLIIAIFHSSAFSQVESAEGVQYDLITGHYYLKSAEQKGGIGLQGDFKGPISKVFPWPVPSKKQLHFALFVPQMVDTWRPFSYAAEIAANRLNIKLSIYSAKGYVNLGRQIKQLRKYGPKHDGVIISAIDSYKMDNVLTEVGEKVPVVAYVNDVYSVGVHAKAMVFYSDLGAQMGHFLSEHIKNLKLKRPVKIAFVMGPKNAAWSNDMKSGVLDALRGDESIKDRFLITGEKHGHTKKQMQEQLVRTVLDRTEGIDILVGVAPAIERAAAIKNEYQKSHPNIQLAAIYFNADLYPAFIKGKILAAGSENLLDTGRLAVSMLLKLVRGERPGTGEKDLPYRVSPAMKIYTSKDIDNFPVDSLFGPVNYEPKLAN